MRLDLRVQELDSWVTSGAGKHNRGIRKVNNPNTLLVNRPGGLVFYIKDISSS